VIKFIRPLGGKSIIDPRTMTVLPVEGADVDFGANATYWTRAIASLDVEEITKAGAKAPQEKAEK
jgi:hypothetical protein